ncbi:uncharacterized protein LOC106464952 isoform X3 [Limulus polyphemus]|uniref:Uncharacterized protein LOC106464952 isoform X3 n=1 Tax=Limulus polyphemus TaxID=6850 RepID=A0ABM1BEX9_LIMPO|nr:uncharacterized protein LOC106464952 isoform X3 [Limulus polyphemus]
MRKFFCGSGVFKKKRRDQLSSDGHPDNQENKVEEYSTTVNGEPSETTTNLVVQETTQGTENTVESPPPREKRSPEKATMYKTCASIELNGGLEPLENANDVTSLSTTSSSNGSCATTVVANTGHKGSPRCDERADTPNAKWNNSNLQTSNKEENGVQKDQKQEEDLKLASSSPKNYSPVKVTVSSSNRKVWTPGQPTPCVSTETVSQAMRHQDEKSELMDASPVWQPFGGGPDEKPQFKSVKMPTVGIKTENVKNQIPQNESSPSYNGYYAQKKLETPSHPSSLSLSSVSSNISLQEDSVRNVQLQSQEPNLEQPSCSASEQQTTETSTLVSGGSKSSRLPPSENPTITLLKKAREGQLPKGALYIDPKIHSQDAQNKSELVDQSGTFNGDNISRDMYNYINKSQDIISTEDRTNYDNFGPQKKGVPVRPHSRVQDQYINDWYRAMYRSLHRLEELEGDYTTVKYSRGKGRVPRAGGYVSEPDYDLEDSFTYGTKYATYTHRSKPERSRGPKTEGITREKQYFESPRTSPVSRSCQEVYKNQPHSIADYEPGRSSIAQREAILFWADFWREIDRLEDEVYNEEHKQRSSFHQEHWPKQSFAFPDGYESDSTLLRKTGKPHTLNPQQQKAWYRQIQRGGEVPFTGLGKPAPEKPRAPAHRYQESEVNIHYRSPVRNLEKDYIEEKELQRKQEDAMRKFYEEERYKKQLHQLEEMEQRRHSDNFIPSQKSPIPLNRYEDPFGPPASPLPISPELRTMARALYNFKAQTAKELTLKKGDFVFINKKIDKNWYLGEHHGMVGIFPVNYVELIPQEIAHIQTPKMTGEGQGRAKYNFYAQTPLELPLYKGQELLLIRRVDQNWYEGRIGNSRGIVPVAYIEVLKEPDISARSSVSFKPPLSSINSSGPITNGTHSLDKAPAYNKNQQSQDRQRSSESHYPMLVSRDLKQTRRVNEVRKELYRVLYSYRPQNEDELELQEGDIVYVMEKCNDGWYVGTCVRTGLLGTFPGNYVERI